VRIAAVRLPESSLRGIRVDAVNPRRFIVTMPSLVPEISMRVVDAALLSGAWLPAIAAAQERLIEKHRWSDPEGRIMGYYSAALAFTPIGAPRSDTRGLEVGLELSYLPPLSEERRSGGFSKTESTNLMPVVPRPRVAYTMPGDWRIEASYVPPVKAFGVKASLLSVALSPPVVQRAGMHLSARIAGSSSRVQGAITCNASVTEEGPGGRLFFTKVCHDRESEDVFHAQALSAEVIASGAHSGRLRPFVGLGVRTERDRFSVGVKQFNGRPDPDHPILEMRVTRPYGMLGATWARNTRSSLGGELFYAPGSLLTVRLLASMRLRGER